MAVTPLLIDNSAALEATDHSDLAGSSAAAVPMVRSLTSAVAAVRLARLALQSIEHAVGEALVEDEHGRPLADPDRFQYVNTVSRFRHPGRRLFEAASEIREMGGMTRQFTWLRRQHGPNGCEIELCVRQPLSCRTP